MFALDHLYDDDISLSAGFDLDEVGFGLVESGVRKLVRTLWQLGYRTVGSCAGHEVGREPYPRVTIPIDLATEGPMKKLAEAVARFNMSRGKDGCLPMAKETWVFNLLIPPTGFSIYLQPCDNNPKRSRERLVELRESADLLAAFFEKQCSDIFQRTI